MVERLGNRAVAESLRSRCTDFMRIISPEFRYGSDSECEEVTEQINKLNIRLKEKLKDADLVRLEQHLVSSKEGTGV